MVNIKKILYSVVLFIVLLIIIQVFVGAIISSVISDVYLKSLTTLLLSIGISLYATRRILNRNSHNKLH